MSMGGSPIGRGGNLPPVPPATVESSTAASTASVPQQGAELRALLATAGLLETQSTTGVQAVSQTTTARDTEAARGVMAPVTAPTVELTPELRRGAQSFSNNFSIAMDDVLADGDLSKMKPDQMLAAFLKLNIEDPNNSVETHNRLSEVMSELRQRAIDDAKAKIAEAEKMREEAEKYAGVVDMINIVVTSVLMIGAAVLTAATFGIGGFALPAAAAAAISISMALAGVVQAGANLTAAEKSLDAQEMALDSKRSQQQADRSARPTRRRGCDHGDDHGVQKPDGRERSQNDERLIWRKSKNSRSRHGALRRQDDASTWFKHTLCCDAR